jgi:hypothetical protein
MIHFALCSDARYLLAEDRPPNASGRIVRENPDGDGRSRLRVAPASCRATTDHFPRMARQADKHAGAIDEPAAVAASPATAPSLSRRGAGRQGERGQPVFSKFRCPECGRSETFADDASCTTGILAPLFKFSDRCVE